MTMSAATTRSLLCHIQVVVSFLGIVSSKGAAGGKGAARGGQQDNNQYNGGVQNMGELENHNWLIYGPILVCICLITLCMVYDKIYRCYLAKKWESVSPLPIVVVDQDTSPKLSPDPEPIAETSLHISPPNSQTPENIMAVDGQQWVSHNGSHHNGHHHTILNQYEDPEMQQFGVITGHSYLPPPTTSTSGYSGDQSPAEMHQGMGEFAVVHKSDYRIKHSESDTSRGNDRLEAFDKQRIKNRHLERARSEVRSENARNDTGRSEKRSRVGTSRSESGGKTRRDGDRRGVYHSLSAEDRSLGMR